MKALLGPLSPNQRAEAAYTRAAEIADEDVDSVNTVGDAVTLILEKLG